MALEAKIKVQSIDISDEDHIWVNGKQYISLKRVGKMIEEDREKRKDTKEPEIDVAALLYKAADAIRCRNCKHCQDWAIVGFEDEPCASCLKAKKCFTKWEARE